VTGSHLSGCPGAYARNCIQGCDSPRPTTVAAISTMRRRAAAAVIRPEPLIMIYQLARPSLSSMYTVE
jgi:hypothetical protein